jgi:hypothetical protein
MATRPDIPDLFDIENRLTKLERSHFPDIEKAVLDHERRFISQGVQIALVVGVLGAIALESLRVMWGDRIGVLLSSLDLLLRQ